MGIKTIEMLFSEEIVVIPSLSKDVVVVSSAKASQKESGNKGNK